MIIAQECKSKCHNLCTCNMILKIYVSGNIPLSVSHIGVSHKMYDLFYNCDRGNGAKVWSYFWEIIETSELGNEVFSNNNNSSNKYIISLWIAVFHCLNMELWADLGYHRTSTAEILCSFTQNTFPMHIFKVGIQNGKLKTRSMCMWNINSAVRDYLNKMALICPH
jgi:hypothetical protein